jgi:putative heme-binding domain-containing protein
MDHPRGLIYNDGHLWVLHPPFLSVYHDDDEDGTADRHETLITGISTDQVNQRGADHTTNGIRMGIDGWIYIAVGDFGFTEARGTDGRVLSRRGGGVVRVRPDGTDMEIYCWGLRNIVDIAVDPYLNLFTRDNTNDGGGWDIRVSHIMQTANYGYPSLYKNFTEEIMPPLANYGGGSGCGVMFFQDERWPAPYSDALYTCDWGRSEVFLHDLPQDGATFEPNEQPFVKIPRPTDIDVDGSGRMYVASWKNGKFNYDGPNIGFVAQITPIDFLPKPFPRLEDLGERDLVAMLASSSAVHRFHAQREILRREKTESLSNLLVELAADKNTSLAGRVAAIFTLKQLEGADSLPALLTLSDDPAVREFALRALTDRKSELQNIPTDPFVTALSDDNPRVRAQALISLGRLGRPHVAEYVLPLTVRNDGSSLPTEEPVWNQPDAGRVLPHLAVQTLRALNAYEPCLKAIPGPYQEGALSALKGMHDERAVDGLFQVLSKTYNPQLRKELFTTLIRLYHREAEYTGGWWGTRPDTTGPYYDRKPWAATPQIESAIRVAVKDSDEATVKHILEQLAKHVVKIEGLPGADKIAEVMQREPEVAIKLPEVDKNDPNLLANIPFEKAFDQIMKMDGDAEKGAKLFRQQSCVACHTYANGQQPKGPHLVDIGKRYKKEELIESILKPDAKIAQGFDTYTFVTEDGKVVTGFVVSEAAETLTLRKTDGLSVELIQDDIDERVKQKTSMMPKGIVNNLTPEQLADLIAYLQTLK